MKDLWDNTKCTSIRIIGDPKGEEKGSENILEDIIAENFCNMGKRIVTQVQEVQRVLYRVNPKRNTPRHIVVRMTKIKDREY